MSTFYKMPYVIQDITEWVYFVFFILFLKIVIDTDLLHINYGLEA